MTFYERYEQLCAERNMKPQTPEIQEVMGVTSGSISGWKKGASPKVEVICRLAEYFNVTADYLLGLSEVRNSKMVPTLTEQERLLLDAYRVATAQGQFHIIQVCMNERDTALKGESINAG